jgi:hypothetical protein
LYPKILGAYLDLVKMVETVVSHRPEEIMDEGGCNDKFVTGLPQLEKYILDNVLRGGQLPNKSKGIGCEWPVVFPEQLLESLPVVLADGIKKF